jgi:hypothetical protein
MTDQNINISERISETIMSIIKKTNVFEKLENMKGLIKISTGFFIITTTLTIANYYFITNINTTNDEQLQLLEDNNKQLSKIVEDNNFKAYQMLETKVDKLLEITIEMQKQNALFLQYYDKKYISVITSMSDFEKYSKPDIFKNNDEELDDELLRECYDILPCNNITKATSTGFFSWK